jgi:hypothetical protein
LIIEYLSSSEFNELPFASRYVIVGFLRSSLKYPKNSMVFVSSLPIILKFFSPIQLILG